jgi:Insulinase (Peptidase family M16)
MIPLYSKRLAQIHLRTNKTTARVTASQLGVLAASTLTVPPSLSSLFFTEASQLHSACPLSNIQTTTLANTPQRIALTDSSPRLQPSHFQQRHLRVTDRRLKCPRKAEISPRFSATHIFRHLRLTPSASRTTYHKMSTLSQPQTPATVESPLREHRHSLVKTVTDQLETPSLDDRQYRVIKLENELEVLLVQDADTDKASAAMDVNVGNFSDPPDMPGLAHCVEHMLFMGTQKVRDLQ